MLSAVRKKQGCSCFRTERIEFKKEKAVSDCERPDKIMNEVSISK